jgi:hypothetical protein
MRVDLSPRSSEVILKLGPIDIPAAMPDMPEHADQMVMLKPQVIKIPITAYIRGFSFELVDGKGRVLPNAMLHHINLLSLTRRELFSSIMQRSFAAGSETGSLLFPRIIGMPVARGDSMIVSVMLHNESEEAYQNVEMRVRLKYHDPGILPTARGAAFLYGRYAARRRARLRSAGRQIEQELEGRPAVPGRIIAVGGHLHKYGTSLRFEDVTAGKILYEGKPQVDSSGEVVGMPRKYFIARLGVPLKTSHVYRLTAFYDNPTGEKIEEGAMGALGGLFVPDDRVKWPAIDRAHPEFLTDYKVTYSGGNSMMMMKHH